MPASPSLSLSLSEFVIDLSVMASAAVGDRGRRTPRLNVHVCGFEGWSLSGWPAFDISLLGRRPSGINDTPGWDKERHIRIRHPSMKELGYYMDNCPDSDSESDEEDAKIAAGGPDSPGIRAYLSRPDNIKYIYDATDVLDRGCFRMKLALPKRIGSTVAASRRFRPRHPLYRKYRPRIDDFCHLAISEYNLGMDQDMEYKRFIWIYVVSVAPLFYITLLASDKRSGEKHYCQAQVIPRDDPPGARPFFPSFVRLPPTDHEDATTLDAHRISTIMIRGLWRSNVAWWRSNVAADPVEAAVQSILAALSYFLLTTDTLLFFQCCTSARFHRKPDTLYFYITFTAKAMGEIDAFYCDTKVRRRGSTYKVLSFSRRSEEGIYRKDKPYVDLKNKKSLSLINQCANAAVGLYNYKTGARMVSPRVVMAYHSLSLGENAYHIRFKASWGTSRPASICSATVIYDDEVEETQKFVFPIEKGEKTLGYVVVESFIIWPGAWQESDLRTKTSETKKQISWGAP